MFVNISPVHYNISETVCSLTFAERCRKTELGGAMKNTNQSMYIKYIFNREINRLKRVIDEYKSQLKIPPTPSPIPDKD